MYVSLQSCMRLGQNKLFHQVRTALLRYICGPALSGAITVDLQYRKLNRKTARFSVKFCSSIKMMSAEVS
jgi:hypothetical protein